MYYVYICLFVHLTLGLQSFCVPKNVIRSICCTSNKQYFVVYASFCPQIEKYSHLQHLCAYVESTLQHVCILSAKSPTFEVVNY